MCACTHLSFELCCTREFLTADSLTDLNKAGQTQKEHRKQNKKKTKESSGNRHSPYQPLSRWRNPDIPQVEAVNKEDWPPFDLLALTAPQLFEGNGASVSWCVLSVLSEEVATWLGLIWKHKERTQEPKGARTGWGQSGQVRVEAAIHSSLTWPCFSGGSLPHGKLFQ